ncbi:MAG: hypothetical protein EAX95_08180 [Candidatus Thorarchaeota archaeon]|nr:hypothetical protein [Candidatus Thorarchaeota archaeon]
MHARKYITMALVMSLLLPTFIAPFATASYIPGSEAAIFGHTFDEEYWTNSSLFIEGEEGGNASLTASYVGVGEFSAFLIAFNELYTVEGDKFTIPYQLFGMHYKTPENKEVFIGAIFAFLMAHIESYGDNNLPDVGHDQIYYVMPYGGEGNPWNVSSTTEPIEAIKLGENHYRFGMTYYNITARVIGGNNPIEFLIGLLAPVITVLISELTVEYDIVIDETGEVHAETLYTVGQVNNASIGLTTEFPVSEVLTSNWKLTAVHYLSIFTSNYRVVRSSTGNTVARPTGTVAFDDNLTIQVGNDNERAFDIGLGREYTLWNETTDPWTNNGTYNALNCLLQARLADRLLIAWQAPLSIFLFAHMGYALSEQLQNTYANVQEMVENAGTAFDNTQWWYGVAFPSWNGLRIEQDPAYTAYTNLAVTDDGDGSGLGFLVIVGVIAIVVILAIRRRR